MSLPKSIDRKTIVLSIGNQTDPRSLATLTNPNAGNQRLCRCAYYLHEAYRAGWDPGEVVDEALSNYPYSSEHQKLVKNSLLRCHRTLLNSKCFEPDNLERLRRGNSAVVPSGPHAGETMEVDHFVPKSLVPALANEFANLRFQPRGLNRRKTDHLSRHQLGQLRVFVRAGILAPSAVEELEMVLARTPGLRQMRRIAPGTAEHLGRLAHLPTLGLNATVPAIVGRCMAELVERIHEWEPRGDSVVSVAECVQRGTTEHVQRAQRLQKAAEARVEEARGTVRELQGELERWRAQTQESLRRATEVRERIRQAAAEAEQSVRRWSQWLAQATEWVRRARCRVEDAGRQVRHAEAALDSARAKLCRAEEELSDASSRTRVVGRDSRGEPIHEPVDTSPYEARVRRAEEGVNHCEERVEQACRNLSEAEGDLDRAQARVNQCQRAIGLGERARRSAEQGESRAATAMSAMERAMEEVRHAEKWIQHAAERILESSQAVAKLAAHAKAAEDKECKAGERLLAGQRDHGEARRSATRGCMEMTWRREQLEAFDRPINELWN